MPLEKSLIVINRWPGRDASAQGWDGQLLDYGSLIPHQDFHVIYVVDSVGKSALPPADRFAYDVIETDSLDDKEDAEQTVEDLLAQLHARWPALDVWRIVCLSEFNMLIGGLLRSRLGVPGMDYRTVLRCRSKWEMRKAVEAAGIREPRFAKVNAATARSQVFSFPMIVKPVIGEGSRGVERIDNQNDLERYLDNAPAEFLAEEYVDAPVYHVDGVVAGGKLAGFICSRYLNTCLDFNKGRCLGSFIVTAPEVNARLGDAAERIVAALGIDNTVFHLELFFDGEEVWFLELGARMAGAEVSYLVHDVFGINLLDVAVRVELGLPLPALPARGAQDRSGGWLLLPEPHHYPSTVMEVSRLDTKVAGVIRELVPAPGYVFERQGHYAALLAGRYVISAPDGDSARERLNSVIQHFYLQYEHAGQTHRLSFPGGI